MTTGKIILSTIILWIIGTAFTFLTCGWLFTWIYEIPPVIWHPIDQMMSTSNLIWSNLAGLLSSFIFVAVFMVFYKGIPGEGIKKGLIYGFLIWLVGTLSGMMSMPLYMTIAPAVVAYWIVQAFVYNLIAGAVVGKLLKKKT